MEYIVGYETKYSHGTEPVVADSPANAIAFIRAAYPHVTVTGAMSATEWQAHGCPSRITTEES